MPTAVRNESGMTLVELLIAMTLMAIGIAAIVAGFSSGIFALDRTDKASTAAVLADQQMEIYRQSSYSSIPTPTAPSYTAVTAAPSTQSSLDGGSCSTSTNLCPGADNRQYWLQSSVSLQCSDGTSYTGSCSTGQQVVKVVAVTVKDATAGCPSGGSTCAGQTLYTESSTFDSLAG